MENKIDNQNTNRPQISVISQYAKDLSFENPGAPNAMITIDSSPSIDISLDVKVDKLSEENVFEVVIIINAKAKHNDKTLFIVDLSYAGIFNLINISEEQAPIFLSIHCPSVIFPYARKIIADATQNGGYQPLMIDPIDFGLLYDKKNSEMRN